MLNLFDLIFVGILLSFFLLSFMRGAIREIFSLLGLTAGLLAAYRLYPELAGLAQPLLPDPRLAEVLSFVLIILVGYLAGLALGGLGIFVRTASGNAANRALGGVLGLAKGLAISLAIYWVIMAYIPPFQDELAGSLIADQLAFLLDYFQDLHLI